jgi:predicted transcriptional regulator
MFLIPNGDDIKNFRKKAGLTQTELAEKASLSQSLIARIESSNVDPRLSTLRKIFDAIEETMKEKKTVKDLLDYKKKERTKLPGLISVSSNQNISDAIFLMKKYGISQLPVITDGKSIGSVVEDVLLEASIEKKRDMSEIYISEVMAEPFPTLNKNSKLEEINKLFSQGYNAVLIIDENGSILGVITKIDMISYTTI